MQKISLIFRKFPLWTALITGAISATGFEPVGLWPLTLLGFALLIHLIARAPSGRSALLTGWLFGVGHFTISNNWIAVAFTFQAAMPIWLGYVSVVTLALYLAVYPALAALGAWWINKLVVPAQAGIAASDGATPPAIPAFAGTMLPLILAFAAFWIITEWLRSWVFTGYVWNPLSISLVETGVPQLFIHKIGTYGLSGIVVLMAGGIIAGIRHFRSPSFFTSLSKSGSWIAIVFGVIFILPVLLATVYPPIIDLVFGKQLGRQGDTSITIVQPNISQADKYAFGYDAINFAKLAMNSRPLPDQGPRLLLWPEAALPDYLEDGYPYRYYQGQPGESAAGARARVARLMGDGDVLITGANRLVIEKGQLVAARNSISAVDANAKLLGHYDKAHLVPYGEYLPLPWLLRPIGLARLVPGDLDFWPGPGPQTMTVRVGGKPVKVGMQICYEIIFSGEVVDRKNRPDFIFNPSNDSWFGTIGPPQFLAQARLRAIEEGLPVVRATPTGISAVIDADGRIVESLPLGVSGRIDARLPAAKAPTLFARYGNILPLGFAALLIGFALLPLARRRASR